MARTRCCLSVCKTHLRCAHGWFAEIIASFSEKHFADIVAPFFTFRPVCALLPTISSPLSPSTLFVLPSHPPHVCFPVSTAPLLPPPPHAHSVCARMRVCVRAFRIRSVVSFSPFLASTPPSAPTDPLSYFNVLTPPAPPPFSPPPPLSFFSVYVACRRRRFCSLAHAAAHPFHPLPPFHVVKVPFEPQRGRRRFLPFFTQFIRSVSAAAHCIAAARFSQGHALQRRRQRRWRGPLACRGWQKERERECKRVGKGAKAPDVARRRRYGTNGRRNSGN